MNSLSALTDILICKGLWLTGQLKYPLSILPQNQYVSRINIDKLCKELPLVVVRRSEKSHEEVFNKFGIMREDVIKKNDIPGMSMNLLGGNFKHEYIKFNPTAEGAKIWDGYEKVFYSKYRKSIHLLSLTTPIFFEVANLHGITFPYQRSKDKDLIKLMNALVIEPIEFNGKIEFHGKSYICHEPTRLNYWHVEFQIKDIENKTIEKSKSAWKKEAAEAALQHIICAHSSLKCPIISDIPKAYYYK